MKQEEEEDFVQEVPPSSANGICCKSFLYGVLWIDVVIMIITNISLSAMLVGCGNEDKRQV